MGRYMGLKKSIICVLTVCLLCFFEQIYCGTVGSDSASSKQLKTFFPASHTNNKMTGFTAFESGLMLENSATACIFDAFFPVCGDITLNGGALYLYRDAVFKSPLTIGPGTIDGREFSLEFPSNVSTLCIPSEYHNKILAFCDEVSIGDNVNCISWSHDDSYIAVVCDSFGGSELQVYSFDGQELALKDSYNFGSNRVYAVDWHPSAYYLAVGQHAADELYTFSYNSSTDSLEQKDTADVERVYAVAWSPDGNKLAVAQYNNNSVLVYDVANGMLSTVRTCTLYADTDNIKNITAQRHGLSWKSSGDYLAASYKRTDNSNIVTYGIKIFNWDGDCFTDDAYTEISDYIYPVAWRPNSSYIAAGLYSSNQRFRLYEHNASASTIEEVAAARIGENRNVYDMKWCSSGNCIAYAKKKGNSNYELQINSFDSVENKFKTITGYNYSSDLRALEWSHDGNYVATGGTGDKLVVLSFSLAPLRFKDVRLFFKSDLVLNGEIVFDGTCTLNMGRNILQFGTDGKITVTNGSHLIIEDARIKGIANNKISCLDDDGVITLRDVDWIQGGNYNFSNGAMIWQNDVLMTGDYIFAYQTKKTSTLLCKSMLELDVGFTFSYNPGSASEDLIDMIDNSSVLLLNGATLHTTVTGLQLTDGKLKVLRDSFLSSEKETRVIDDVIEYTIDNGITFGNSDSAHDLVCDIFSGVTLHILQGSLNYRNILASSWNMTNFTSVLHVYANTQLNVYQNLNLDSGSVLLGDNAVLGRALGKDITGSIRPQGTLLYTNI